MLITGQVFFRYYRSLICLSAANGPQRTKHLINASGTKHISYQYLVSTLDYQVHVEEKYYIGLWAMPLQKIKHKSRFVSAYVHAVRNRHETNHAIFRYVKLAFVYAEQLGSTVKESTIENVVELANPGLLAHTLEGDTVDRSQQWANEFDSIIRIQKYCESRGIEFFMT